MATFMDDHNINVSYVKCPFNANHKIPANRLAKHVAKCQKNTCEPYLMCPFNSAHVMAKSELGSHLKLCKERILVLYDYFENYENECERAKQKELERVAQNESEIVKTNLSSSDSSKVEDKPICDEDWD